MSNFSIRENTSSRKKNFFFVFYDQWDMILVVARLVPTIISLLHLGVWSDGVGRKTVIAIGLLGEFVDGISRILNVYFFSAPLYFLLPGSIITGRKH